MDCARADQLIQQAAAATLSADEREALQGHFDDCPECAGRRGELRFAELAGAARIPELPLPAELQAQLLAIEQPERSAIELALGGPLRVSAPALAFAALVMGLLLLTIAPAVDDDGALTTRSGPARFSGPNAELLEGLIW